MNNIQVYKIFGFKSLLTSNFPKAMQSLTWKYEFCLSFFLQCTDVVYLLNNNKFLERDTTFTVNITSLEYMGLPDSEYHS